VKRAWAGSFVVRRDAVYSNLLGDAERGKVMCVNEQRNVYTVRFNTGDVELKPEELMPWAPSIMPLAGEALVEKRVQAELDPDTVSPQLLHASGARLARGATLCPDPNTLPEGWITLEEAEALRRADEEEAERQAAEDDVTLEGWAEVLAAAIKAHERGGAV
jgi:hypothetical protein